MKDDEIRETVRNRSTTIGSRKAGGTNSSPLVMGSLASTPFCLIHFEMFGKS